MMKRLLTLAAFAALLTPERAWAQTYDANGNLMTLSAQGAGSAGASAFWTARLSDGASYITIATDRTTAAGPFSVRLSDGAAFYIAPSSGQLPAALVGGRLDINMGSWFGSTAPTVGQKTMASSLPVVISSDQSAVAVSGTISVSGAVDTELPAAAALADNTANPTAPAVGTFLHAWDGTNWDRVQTGAAAGGAVKVDGSAVTQPISAASLPLPTGAATSANQDGIVRDGAGDTTQANVSTGRLHVDGSGVTQPVSGTVTANAGTGNFNVVGTKSNNGGVPGSTNLGTLPAVANAAAPTHTETNQVALRTQLDGDLVMVMEDELPAGTQNIGDVDVLTLPSVTIGTFPDNEPFNLNQLAGAAISSGNGVSGTGTLRVAQVSDGTGTLATVTTVTNLTNLPNEGQQTAANSISVTPDTDNDAIGATGAAPPGEANFVGGLTSGATGGFVTGFAVCDSFVNVNVSTATTTLLVTGVSGRHVRICSFSLVTAAANNVALISGTGATCGTGTTGMSGGTTAAAGWNFSANGGITQGSGLGAVNQTNSAGDSVCIITSTTTQLSGRLSYAIY